MVPEKEELSRVLIEELRDLLTILDHLRHVTKTTEAGVLGVLNRVDEIMEVSSTAPEFLEGQPNNDVAGEAFNRIQDTCFNIITSLEFEDINRQLLEKVQARLQLLISRISEVTPTAGESGGDEATLDELALDTPFQKELKRIIDIEGAKAHDQEQVDEIFDAFDL